MAGRFQYNSINVDFDEFWNEFNIRREANNITQVAGSGAAETLNLYNQDIISLSRKFISSDLIAQLREWYEYVRDGSTFKLWYDKDLLLYITFDSLNAQTNDGNDETFTRATVATYINSNTGLVTDSASGILRTENGKFGDALLIEKACTNLLDNTEDFSHADWTANASANMTVTANQMIAPDGTVTADALLADGADDQYVEQQTATAIGTDSATFSVWLRALNGNVGAGIPVSLKILSSTPAEITSNLFYVTTEWQRFALNFENVIDRGALTWTTQIRVENDGDEVYVWGSQLETSKYKTSYIEDNGTRNAETIYYSIPDWFDETQWSASFWIKPNWWDIEDYIPSATIDVKRTFFSLATSGPLSRFYLEMDTSDQLSFTCYDYELNSVTKSDNTHGLLNDTWNYIVITFDSTIDNGIKFYVNGSLTYTSTNYDFIPTDSATRLYVGSNAGSYQLDALIDDFIFENRILTANQISGRYNSNQAIGLRQNYWSAVRLVNPTFNPISSIGCTRWELNTQLIEDL